MREKPQRRSIWSSKTPEHTSLCIYSLRKLCTGQCSIRVCVLLALNQQTTCMCILLRQVPMSSIALPVCKKHARHCEQHGALLRTDICGSKHGTETISAANQDTFHFGCGMVWHRMCYANSQGKEGFHNTK